MPGQFEKSAVRMGGPWGGPLAAKKKRAAEGTTVEAGVQCGWDRFMRWAR